jgi:hypothetical protein
MSYVPYSPIGPRPELATEADIKRMMNKLARKTEMPHTAINANKEDPRAPQVIRGEVMQPDAGTSGRAPVATAPAAADPLSTESAASLLPADSDSATAGATKLKWRHPDPMSYFLYTECERYRCRKRNGERAGDPPRWQYTIERLDDAERSYYSISPIFSKFAQARTFADNVEKLGVDAARALHRAAEGYALCSQVQEGGQGPQGRALPDADGASDVVPPADSDHE